MDSRKDRAISIALEFLQSGVDLPFSSATGPQLLAFSQQPTEDIEIQKFVNLVQVDPGLTTKILQLANSAYFARIDKIISLRQAVVHIGLEEVMNFIYVLFYRKALPSFPNLEGCFSDKDYWGHSWACAVANRMLGHPDVGTSALPGELYLAGLLHGIGKLILASRRPDDFLQCLHNSSDFEQPLAEAQLDVFGTTDSEIAYELLRTWQLPENICMAIKYYQSPEDADEKFREIAGLTQFAYYLANTSGIGNINDEFCYDFKKTWIFRESSLPLSEEATHRVIMQKIYTALESKSSTITTLGGTIEDDRTGESSAVSDEKKKTTSVPEKKGFIAWLRALFTLN